MFGQRRKRSIERRVMERILLRGKGKVENFKKYQAGKSICQHLERCVTEGNVSLSFLNVIKKERDKVSMLCAVVLNTTMPTSSLSDIRKQVLNRISELMGIVEDCSKKIQLLETAIKYGKKLSNDFCAVNGIENIIETFNNLKETWRSRRVYELLDDDMFWGEVLLPLLSPAEALQPLINSLSFRALAKKGLKEVTNSIPGDSDTKATDVVDFYSMMGFLTTKVIEQLQMQWNPVLHDPGSLSVETMKTLLGTLKDQNRLDEELKLMAKYFRRNFSPMVKTYFQDFVRYPNILEQVQHVINILKIFGLTGPSNQTMSMLVEFQTILENSSNLTLAQLHKSVEDVKQIVSPFSGEGLDCVIKELSRSSELLCFIEEIVDEDIRFLIDAVEEHSDQFVSESSVSDLIDVHSFLAPLVKKKTEEECDPLEFLKMLKESCLGHQDIAVKIQQCSTNVNSLRGLYTSIANRGEITKEIIGNCLSRGEYCVSQKDGTKMSYLVQGSDGNKRCNYSLSDLHDLRSRAHLIVSSHKNASQNLSSHDGKSDEEIDFDDFINQVNLLTEISTLLSKLRSSGYAKYRQFWKKMKTTDELQTNRDDLRHDLESWENLLEERRKKFYFLNYYRSDQLCKLYDFFTNASGSDSAEVLSLIHFVDQKITKQQIQKHKSSQNEEAYSNDSPKLMLTIVGETLENIFSDSQPTIRLIPESNQSQSYSKLEATVTSGEIFVASLEPESPLTANVMLTLYENTSQAFPQPYQIVFCTPETTWEELHLLLQRCFGHSGNPHCKSLFCIANVELLPNELQFKLVIAIKDRQKCYESCETVKENADYQLALICRGGDHHHIVEQFAQYSHHIAGMTDLALAHRLRCNWPHVKMVTSSLPGLGKTEHIKRDVLKKEMNVATFSISGPFEPEKLVQRLGELKLKKYHCLHLDIGAVSDPMSLDTFLFQLIVTGMVSAGNQFYHLPTKHIYIEIANTLKDWLRESLVVSKYFNRVHWEWQNYKDFLVSCEITSNEQVVCQYLDIFDRACIESKEIHFNGPQKAEPLPAHRCQELLTKYFSSDADITFTTLHTFLAVLADQLLKFSKSAFFKIASLKSMIGKEAQGVRTNLFRALVDVSKEFASRAITTCGSSDIRNLSQKESASALDEAKASTAMSAKDMVERVKGMIQWEDSNHLLVVFHGIRSQAITAVYRDRTGVPPSVEKLLKSQDVIGNKELENFKTFSQEQLQKKLEKIACMKVVEENNLFPGYALTPDNILKMILIILRVRVNAPVIIMGETGCGKTSLVRYLANTCGVQFYAFNFHAGISEKDVAEFIIDRENHAKDKNEQIWIFLDEINTCDHLGLICDIMCHHSLRGRPLSSNLVFLAACNPYKIRSAQHIKTAGLEGKTITDEYSGLVYRVHPLPEAMIDYVWDYGSLGPNDERDYIQRMVRNLPKEHERLLVDLLSTSQKFIREAEDNPFCVSLRDVHRCIRLIGWFQQMIERKKKEQIKTKKDDYPSHLHAYHLISEQYDKKPTIKSIVLALAHCYLSRLPTAELRKKYRGSMMNLFHKNGTIMDGELDTFAAIVRMEEEDYLDRMELPSGTAKNAALRENVFVMLVCILNRIPIFVVGKPGCSKSLSIQLIRSNLRGRDSRDRLFRELPQLYVVSYQGSESSTSEGIIKVFEKAKKYKSVNENALPVVLLDEVGLAENSKYNPLKVLHSLLEPGEGKLPDVAVVGISNWSLDAAKMNRAIHLSRPEPTKEDLYETGLSLHFADGNDYSQNLTQEELQCLAEAYFEYQNQQTHANFHGLRDYYSLIKSLTGCSTFEQVNISLQRNFGGLPGEVTNIQNVFLEKLKKVMIYSGQDIIPVTELIQANLKDPHARHLMLITSGDSAIGILKQSLETLDKETITIYGSRFEEDLSEEYNYRILSRIILCMERDCILILKDLESIYGSLYDMLNQNYAVVGNRKNCRVALGAYSNPMCQVNDGFRCIVLIDQHKVDFSDPPFLNRFEKQLLRFSDVLDEKQQNVIVELRHWVEGMSTVEGLESHFNESDMFIGFYEDTLPSLVLSHGSDENSPTEELLTKCKDDLMWIASPDGLLRTKRCKQLKEDSQEVQSLSDEYFKKALHQGFAAFMEYLVANHQKSTFFASDEIGSKTVVMTFSNIHTNVQQCLGNGVRSQVERLSAYKSEKQLAEKIEEFWNASEKELLVLQCKPDLDGTHLLLARSIIEDKRNSYKQCLAEMDHQGYKHVCIVVHVQRGENEGGVPWQFSFLCGWRQVFLDLLEVPTVPLNTILGESVQKLLTSIWPIRLIAQNDLLWCFTCIKYTRKQRSVDTVLTIAKNLFNSEAVSKIIEKIILGSINLNITEQDHDIFVKESWQVKVACDRQSLVNSSTLYCAMEQFVARLVRIPLAKIVFFLEKENAWPPHVGGDVNETLKPMLEDLWCNLITDDKIFKISEITEPLGAESYVLDSTSLDLCLPFSQVVVRKIDGVKELFLEDYETLTGNEENLDENGQLKQAVQQQQLERFALMISDLFPELRRFESDCHDLYMDDIFDMITADFNATIARSERVSVARILFVSEFKQLLPVKDVSEFFTLLHTFSWVNREQILDVLRMVDCCKPAIGLKVLSSVMDDVFSNFDVMFVKSNEAAHSQEGANVNSYSTNKSEVLNNVFEETLQPSTNENDSTYDTALNLDVESNENATEQSETKLADIQLELEDNVEEAVEDVVQDDEEEPVEEDVNHNEDSEKIGDILVTAYCEELFPSQETIEKTGGFESWKRNSNMLLSLAVKICEHSPAFHYLRLCVDFSRIVLTPAALPTDMSSLFALSEIGKALRPEYLDHEESFQTITDQIIKQLDNETKNQTDRHEDLQKFVALFYGRCIDTNVDTSSACQIVEHVLSLERPELVMMMSPVVLRLLMVEEMQSNGIFIRIISNPSVMDDCPCLQQIDQLFKDLFRDGSIHHDSLPTVTICDLIERLLNFDGHYKIDDLNSSDCEALLLAKSSSKLISQTSEDDCGLRVFSAVAFLRGFFAMLAKFVGGDPTALNEDVQLMTEVDSLMKDPKTSLGVFFMKKLHEHASLFNIQKWLSGNNVLSTTRELWCNEKSHDKGMFVSVLKYPEYEEAKAAYYKLMSNESSDMLEFLTKSETLDNHAFCLLGILLNMVYKERAVRKLTDKEEQLVDWFADKVASSPRSILFQQLFLGIIGRRDFQCTQLQLSPESSVEEVEMALLILHIACVVATGVQNDKLPMYRYFTNPDKHACVLAHSNVDMHSVHECQLSIEQPVPITCECGLRLAFSHIFTEKLCPRCHEALNDEIQTTVSSQTKQNSLISYSGDTNREWELRPKHMPLPVYRALHFMVYAAYYAGIALGTSLKEKLSIVLELLGVAHSDKDYTNPGRICFEKIEADLSHLMKILSCRKDIAINTMHLVVEKSSDLIKSEELLELTPEMHREWEAKFSQLTEAMFLKSREPSEVLKLQQTDGNQETTLKGRILELDNYPDEPTEQNRQLKRLFRLTKAPSFEDFHSALLNLPKDVQEKHRFMSLFFAICDQLPIIGNLHRLLKWSRQVSSALTHRVSRKNAESRSINDFINGYLLDVNKTPQGIENLKLLFNDFKEAWNDMRSLVNQKLKDKKEKMPWLVETDYIAYCLIESEYGVYLKTAVEILVSLQNSILDSIIVLSSSHRHPALDFLEKENGSGVMSVSIQDVKEKEIISFQWSDDLFKYAQNNPEYSKGQEITYDFEQMEMSLATRIAFGKCYLTGTLNKFIFAKELFHSCGPLLTEIRSLVKQSPILPDEVRKGLVNLKERRIKEAQDLLQHMEVLIYLLKRKLKNFNVDMTLEELAEKWSPMLPSPFPINLLPEPKSSIRIKHVAALYEALEDVLADGAIDGLNDKFRFQLPLKMKETIRTVVEKETNQLKLVDLLGALRRFVFRYLSSETERYWPEESTALQSCLKEPSLWSPLPPPNLNVIPKEINLEYMHSVVKYLEEIEKEKKDNTNRLGLRSSTRQPQTIRQSGKPGRRRIKNF